MVREQRFIRIIVIIIITYRRLPVIGRHKFKVQLCMLFELPKNVAFLISALLVTFIQIQFFPSLFEHKILLWTLSCDFAAQNE